MRNGLLAAVLLLGVIGVSSVSAAVVDQECLFNINTAYGLTKYVEGQGSVRSVFGQEFVPSLSGLVGLDLGVWRTTPDTKDIIEEANLAVYIHEDTIGGGIIAQGMIENALYHYPLNNEDDWWMSLDFDEVVQLEVGRTYVIELYEIEIDTFAWVPGNYDQGSSYIHGDLDSSYDFSFRTYAVPEPLTLSLLGVGALAFLRKRK